MPRIILAIAHAGIALIAFLAVLQPTAAQQSDRGSGTAPPRVASAAQTYQCRGTVYCREMRSCEEAMFHLQRCGQSRLDADRDGVPCERGACGGGIPSSRR